MEMDWNLSLGEQMLSLIFHPGRAEALLIAAYGRSLSLQSDLNPTLTEAKELQLQLCWFTTEIFIYQSLNLLVDYVIRLSLCANANWHSLLRKKILITCKSVVDYVILASNFIGALSNFNEQAGFLCLLFVISLSSWTYWQTIPAYQKWIILKEW
jgi:hypothetical protein